MLNLQCASTSGAVVRGRVLMYFQSFHKPRINLPLAGSTTVGGTLARAASTVPNLSPLATLALDLSEKYTLARSTGELERVDVPHQCGHSHRSVGLRFRPCIRCWCGAGQRCNRCHRYRGPQGHLEGWAQRQLRRSRRWQPSECRGEQ